MNSFLNKKDFDLVFFTWPYFIDCPEDLDIPILFIPHDFNYKHRFGSLIYSETDVKRIEKEHKKFFRKAKPIVSSKFIASEIEKFYPEYFKNTEVIPLSPFIPDIQISKENSQSIIKDLNIGFKYILCPTNITFHKNINNLISAFYKVKQRIDIKLIFCGFETEYLTGKVNPNYCLDLVDIDKADVLGLGYVTDEILEALFNCAELVVTPSLYEAGNGPGLDAWRKGIPVAMSNIAPFTEHIEVLGVKAEVFDPTNTDNMADVIYNLLSNKAYADENAKISKTNIHNYTWEQVAKKYLEVFDKHVNVINKKI